MGASIMEHKKINKKILFAAWGAHNKKWHTYQLWDKVLRRAFKEVATFDPQEETYQKGKAAMNLNFLETLAREKPDYVFFWFMHDEFKLETLAEIKKINPYCKTFCYNGDDDYKFENYTLVLFPFIDYFLITQVPFISLSQKYHKKAFSACGADTEEFKELPLSKKYDVSFVGTPKNDRVEYMRHLANNGINIKVFGAGWQNYPDLKKYHGGEIKGEEFINVINESKINICLSKNYFGGTHILERFFEINACNSFGLTEYASGYFPLFTEGKDIATFKNKEELLSKIKYYLSNESKRKKIAKEAYKKTVANFSNEQLLHKALKVMESEKSNPDIPPEIKSKYYYLSKKELFGEQSKLTKLLTNIDYVCIKKPNYTPLPFKEYIQMYLLNTTKKNICLVDSVLNHPLIGDYASVANFYAYTYDTSLFKDHADIAQVMVRKDFFLKNIQQFREWFYGKIPNFISPPQTIMTSYPLIRTTLKKKIPLANFEHIFFAYFERDLLSLRNQHNLFKKGYIYRLGIYCLFLRPSLLKHIIFNTIKKTKNPKLIRWLEYLKK